MRRIAAFALLVAFAVGLVAPGIASAQSGTPTTGASGAIGIPVGTTVPYIGQDGAQIGTITVNSITDPYQGYDPSTAPQRGYHYALADVTIANTGSRPFEVNPSSIQAIDTDGFIAEQSYITRTDADTVPDLVYTDALAPGTEATGVIPFQLFGDTTIERVVYSPSYDRLITLVDVRTEPVVAGAPVTVIGSSGEDVAEVVVNSITDPFEGFDASSAPPRGSRFVLVDLTVTNVGTQVLSVSPSDLWVTDADGFVLQSAYITRVDATTLPDYNSIDLQPGDSQRGAIVYQVFEGVPATQIAYGDGYERQIVVADLSAGLGTSTVPATNAPSPTTAAVVTAIAVDSNPDCAGLVDWGLDLVDRITRASDLTAPFSAADASTLDPVTVRDVATQLRAMGDEQTASNPPAAASALNTLMAEQFYYPLADAVDQIATALESSNPAGALLGQMAAKKVTDVFAEGGAYDELVNDLTTACPNEVDALNQAA